MFDSRSANHEIQTEATDVCESRSDNDEFQTEAKDMCAAASDNNESQPEQEALWEEFNTRMHNDHDLWCDRLHEADFGSLRDGL